MIKSHAMVSYIYIYDMCTHVYYIYIYIYIYTQLYCIWPISTISSASSRPPHGDKGLEERIRPRGFEALHPEPH